MALDLRRLQPGRSTGPRKLRNCHERCLQNHRATCRHQIHPWLLQVGLRLRQGHQRDTADEEAARDGEADQLLLHPRNPRRDHPRGSRGRRRVQHFHRDGAFRNQPQKPTGHEGEVTAEPEPLDGDPLQQPAGPQVPPLGQRHPPRPQALQHSGKRALPRQNL